MSDLPLLLHGASVLEYVGLRTMTGVDAQGLPTYADAVQVQARAVRQAKLAVGTDGSQVTTTLTVWIPAEAAVLPREQDMLVYAGRNYIVVEAKDVKRLTTSDLVHVRVRCRDE